jgi:hypothetical protein
MNAKGLLAAEGAEKLCSTYEDILPEALKAKDMSARHKSYRIFDRAPA